VLQIGGIVRRASHSGDPNSPLNGGPQMVEVSRDGKRVYFTNSLYSAWDEQVYPEGIRTWFVKADAASDGSLHFDPKFFVTSNEHRLQPSTARRWRRLFRFLLLSLLITIPAHELGAMAVVNSDLAGCLAWA
jgi:56kDa selenium binding protein (SBP56)